MGNTAETAAPLEQLKSNEGLISTELRRKVISELKNDILSGNPSNILELLVAGQYQEAVATRVMEFVEDEELIVNALDILKLIFEKSEKFAKTFFVEYSGSNSMVTGLFSKSKGASTLATEIIFMLSCKEEKLDWLDKNLFEILIDKSREHFASGQDEAADADYARRMRLTVDIFYNLCTNERHSLFNKVAKSSLLSFLVNLLRNAGNNGEGSAGGDEQQLKMLKMLEILLDFAHREIKPIQLIKVAGPQFILDYLKSAKNTEIALQVQLKIYLYSSQEDIKNMKSFVVIHRLIKEAAQKDHRNTTFLARFCLLLLCKTLQNQAVMVRFGAVSVLEEFHDFFREIPDFPFENPDTFTERVKWISKFAKQAGQLTLKGTVNSMAMTALYYLKAAEKKEEDCSRCLKAMAYLYLMGLCEDERYGEETVVLTIGNLRRAIGEKQANAKYLKNALRAVGSLLINPCWQGKFGRHLETIGALLIRCQEINLGGRFQEEQKLINNDAKLSLTLVDCNLLTKEYEGRKRKGDTKEEKEEYISQQAENVIKAVLLKALRCQDVFLLCKALHSIGLYATRTHCEDRGFMHIAIERITLLCDNPNPWVAREAANCLVEFTTSYDRLQLWLKFESACLSLDSANLRIPKLYGAPLKLPDDKGLYNHWGAFFDFGDLLVLDEPIHMDKKTWTISFWMPTPVLDTGKQHTLIQSARGVRYLAIDPTGTKLGTYDESKTAYLCGVEMDRLSPYKWHSFIVRYSECEISYYVDYVCNKKTRMYCEDAIKFIGNSADGLEPFGTFCDLRITDRLLKKSEMKLYSCYAPNFVDVLPDSLATSMSNAVPYLAKALHLNILPTTTAILKLFGNLASNGEGRKQLINANVLPTILTFMNSQNPQIQREALRIYVSLG